MKNEWIRAGQHALSGWLSYLPAIIITWFVAGVAGGEVQVAPQLAQTGLTIICIYFYVAAAARTRGLSDESTFWLGLSRPGSEIMPILIALGMLIIGVIGLVAGMVVAYQMQLDEETCAAIGLVCAVLFCVWIMTRIWAVFSVPYFFKGKYRWSAAAHGIIWSGPGLGLALKLRRLSIARKATLTFMIPLLALLLPLLAARLQWGSHFILDFFFYVAALPFLTMLNLNLTEQLLVEYERLKEKQQ